MGPLASARTLQTEAHEALSYPDLTINTAGFVPLGGFLCLVMRQFGSASYRAAFLGGLAGFALSLAIESLQVLMPLRD